MKTCIIPIKRHNFEVEIKRKALKNFKQGSAGERPLRLGLKFKTCLDAFAIFEKTDCHTLIRFGLLYIYKIAKVDFLEAYRRTRGRRALILKLYLLSIIKCILMSVCLSEAKLGSTLDRIYLLAMWCF